MYTKNLRGSGPKWLSGTIVKITGPVSVIVELAVGSRVRKHFDQIKKRESDLKESSDKEQSFELELPEVEEVGIPEPPTEPLDSCDTPDPESNESEPSSNLLPASNCKTYPTRNRKPPDYLSKSS